MKILFTRWFRALSYRFRCSPEEIIVGAYSEYFYEKMNNAVDRKFYLASYRDVAASGIDPLIHYIDLGAAEGRNPNGWFDTEWYLTSNPDVKQAGINPLYHYVCQGEGEGRAPTFGMARMLADEHASEVYPDVESVLIDFFDEEFYRRRAGLSEDLTRQECVAHYVLTGWSKGCDPHPEFSTSYYLSSYPDVALQGINPYYHYLVAGRYERRFPSRPGGWRTDAALKLVTPARRMIGWQSSEEKVSLVSADISAALNTDNEGMVVSLSHDNYAEVGGGVQKYIRTEQKFVMSSNQSYIHFSPLQPSVLLADEISGNVGIRVVLNGELVGVSDFESVTKFLSQHRQSISRFVVHALQGWATEVVEELILAADCGQDEKSIFWLHDNFTLCPNYSLKRNDIDFCGAPPVSKPSLYYLYLR